MFGIVFVGVVISVIDIVLNVVIVCVIVSVIAIVTVYCHYHVLLSVSVMPLCLLL